MDHEERVRFYEALHRLKTNPDFKILHDNMVLDLVDLQKALVTEIDHKKISWIQGAAQHIQNRLMQIREAGEKLEALKTNQDGG